MCIARANPSAWVFLLLNCMREFFSTFSTANLICMLSISVGQPPPPQTPALAHRKLFVIFLITRVRICLSTPAERVHIIFRSILHNATSSHTPNNDMSACERWRSHVRAHPQAPRDWAHQQHTTNTRIRQTEPPLPLTC